MGWLSSLRRNAPPPEPVGRKRGKAVRDDHAEQSAALRARARQRLIGAAVLVGLGVVAFPLVFETQPRPVPMDLPIVIPAQDAPAKHAVAPAALPASLPSAASLEPPASPRLAAASTPGEPPLERATTQPERTVPAPKAEARFVVQVGAFADKSSAQAARRKLEARGLKTYAQVVQTGEGERIRVRLGPFGDRAEADKAAAAAKAAGLAGSVLTL